MRSHLLHIFGISAVLTLLLFSCRQAQDLDTDRTVVPTNVPEITDFSPKVGTFDEKITIVGKNFLNVERVMLDNIQLDSVRVENRNRITAQLPFGRAAAGVYKSGLRSLSVTTKSGVGISRPEFALAWGMILGRITMNGTPLGGTEVFFRDFIRDKSGKASTSPQSLFSGEFANGWFLAGTSNFYPASPRFDPAEFVIRPFRSGYTFTPPERTILTGDRGRVTQVQEFEAALTPPENMPTVTAITPDTASSSGASGTPTGTEITIRGKGLSGVRRVLIGILYTPFMRASEYIYHEATILSVEGDTQVTVRLPRMSYVVLGNVYTNCPVYVIRDDTSLLAPQRITITSR
jgi:hypothetical protein